MQRTWTLSFLQFTPFIEHLQVKSNNLIQQLPLTPLVRLHTLELESIKLTSEDMLYMNSWAPHLKHLKLKSYNFIARWTEYIDMFEQNIRLPELALDTLAMEGALESKDLCISLAIASFPPRLFFAAPS